MDIIIGHTYHVCVVTFIQYTKYLYFTSKYMTIV